MAMLSMQSYWRGRNWKVQPNTPDNLSAWVVFSGRTELAWLRILKPGFRHCYVLFNDGDRWISIDPLSNYTDINVHSLPSDFDLPGWLLDRGHTVVSAPILRPYKQAPWMLFTCVEAVKRALGIHKRFVLTPYQLYRYLLN